MLSRMFHSIENRYNRKHITCYCTLILAWQQISRQGREMTLEEEMTAFMALPAATCAPA